MNIIKQRGFSLIELMIVVVIIGIIAAFAIPNYSKYQKQARIEEAKAILLEQVQILQREYGKTYTYSAKLSGIDEKTKFFDIKSSQKSSTDATKFEDSACGHVVVKSDTFCLVATPSSDYTEEKRVVTANHLGEIKLCSNNTDSATCELW